MEIEDDTSLKDVEDQESRSPSLPITSTVHGAMSTIVYQSKPTMLELSGHPILADFGQMRLIEGCVNQDWWMSDLYRAPEVLLQLPWGFPVDIWAIGVMVSRAHRCGLHASKTLTVFHDTDPRASGREKPLRSDRSCSWPICTSTGFSTVYRISWPSATAYHSAECHFLDVF